MRHHVLQYNAWYLTQYGSASFLAYVILFRLVSPKVSRCITDTYRGLNKYEQAEWNDRFISNINAIVTVTLSGYSLLLEPGLRHDLVWYDSPTARANLSIVVGYMFADILCMVLWCKTTKSELLCFIFHHGATAYSCYIGSVFGVLCYFALFRLLAELSTLSVNQRWYFDTMGYPRTSTMVLINGLLMVLSFFLVRIITMPIYWYKIWKITNKELIMKLGYLPFVLYIPCVALDPLNFFWFYKMFRGFMKALKGLKRD